VLVFPEVFDEFFVLHPAPRIGGNARGLNDSQIVAHEAMKMDKAGV
jgi:hypothetical protein